MNIARHAYLTNGNCGTDQLSTSMPIELCKIEPPEVIECVENPLPIDNTFETSLDQRHFPAEVTIDQRDFNAIFPDEVKQEKEAPAEPCEYSCMDSWQKPGSSRQIKHSSTRIRTADGQRIDRKRPPEPSKPDSCSNHSFENAEEKRTRVQNVGAFS